VLFILLVDSGYGGESDNSCAIRVALFRAQIAYPRTLQGRLLYERVYKNECGKSTRKGEPFTIFLNEWVLTIVTDWRRSGAEIALPDLEHFA
jgi:hypothetical protein